VLRHRSGRVLELGSVHVMIPSTQRASSNPCIGNMCISRSDAFTNITGKAVALIPANAWCSQTLG
jgi:hypothetical protein